MGRLIGLELHDFKSYKGSTSVGFGDANFTSIIGPNGSGKSNMMDAISFVLGVSSQHLRSTTLKDLIYRGRQNHQLTETEAEKCHVTAIYEDDQGETVTFTRSVSANSSSDYKINGKAVTATQYLSILKRENILIKARNFLVFQGDVEQIALQNPKDLTKLIETISGSGELAQQYLDLKDARDAAHELTNSVFARKRVLNSELKQYKEQMEEQEIFEKTLQERSDLVKFQNLYKLYHNEQKHIQYKSKIDDDKLKIAELKVELKLEVSHFKSLAADHAKTELQIKKHKKSISTNEETLDLKRKQIIPLQQNKSLLSSKIGSSRKKLSEIQLELGKQKENVTKLERQHVEARQLLSEFLARKNNDISIDEEGQQLYESLKTEFLSAGGAKLEQELDTIMSNHDSAQLLETNLDEQIDKHKVKIAELKDTIDFELQNKVDDYSNEINDALEQKINLEKSKELLLNQERELKYKELSLNTKLRDILLKIDDLKADQRETQKQKKLRETITLLRKLAPSGLIKGCVADLVRPTQYQYSTALQCLLGSHADLIIVQTAQVAHQCIQILKERRSGVATFIPLDTISVTTPNLGYLRLLHSQVKPGLDIVEFDDQTLQLAIQYVVGDSLVAESLDVARLLKWGDQVVDKRIVTIEGSLIHKSGLITGGTRQGVETTRWNKNEWKSLNDTKDDLLDQLNKLAKERPNLTHLKNIEDEITQWEDKLPALRVQKQNLERVIRDRETEIEFHQTAIESCEEEKTKRFDLFESLKQEVAAKEAEIKNLQDSIYKSFCEKYNFSEGIQEFEEMNGSSYRRKVKERTKFSKAISTLSSKLDFENEKLNASESRYERLKDQIQELEAQLLQVLEKLETIQNEVDQAEAEIQISNEELQEMLKTLQKKKKSVSEIESGIDDINKDIEEVSNQLVSYEESLLGTDIERVNILKNCKIESIIIPLVDGLLDTIPFSDNIDDLIKEIYNFEINYELVTAKYRSPYNSKTMSEIDAKIVQLNEDLDQLAPNAKAKERLHEADKKLKDFDRDLNKAKLKEKKTLDAFNEIKEKRIQMFMEAFDHISGEIDGVFKDLTKLSMSPLGGSAYLTLEDEEEPYLAGIKYHAMPPTKRFRDMELLSGGEKTIAALALLFAVHLYQPSPFFVLDEVDAALDNSNVSKIANYIKSHASPKFQFIVISLKSSLFQTLDSLVGIYRDQKENSSKTVTLDLRKYDEEVLAN